MTSALQLPNELWLQVFSFLSWKDKLSMRCTCSHFKQLLDECRPLWRGFSVVLKDLSRYNRAFWRSLARRQLDSVALRGGRKRDLKLLSVWLPLLQALRLDTWRGNDVQELKRFRHVHSLTVTACSEPLVNLEFLLPLGQQLTQLSLCNVQLACPPSQLLASLSRLTRLRSLVLHHDGCLKIPTLRGVLSQLVNLNSLSWTMINYKRLTQDFFCPATGPAAGASLQLSELQLLNYDAAVTPEVLQPLANLRSLSVFHLYSVPGPTCHLQTWLSSLQQLCSLSVHGGHPLVVYADFLPSSLRSLTLCVDLQPEDLQIVSFRAPNLRHLHLEPWSSSSKLVRLLPQLFPGLRTLAIRHHHASDEDFLGLHRLQHLNTLEVLDSFYRPDPKDPSLVVNKPSPRLLQLISDLQKLTNHKVRVLTSSHIDLLPCGCV
ncbi:PREDICTED: uncharacterized protein LOC106927417 [Poecilia mexicana]|uniref:F-box domain-containing protein n=1 Tax=Poecilia mexicana TaxID=48701 RepID=A0A3B3X0W7_9TELE|nr:PREDICTED: uncharacterized protein LOC106927417 [Poecilia mexicana]